MAAANGTTIEGPIPDQLFGLGEHPRAEATVEYLAGGHADLPLAGQVLLAQECDDLQRDLGHRVYEVMANDPTVRAGLVALWAGILDGNFRIEPRVKAAPGEDPDPATDRGRQVATSAEVHDSWERQLAAMPRSPEDTSVEFLRGMIYGTKLAEKVYAPGEGPDAGRLVLADLAFKRHLAWSFLVDPAGRVVAIRGLQAGGGYVDLPPQKFAVFTWAPEDGDPRGRSLLRAAYNGWNLKISTWPKLFKYLDRFGTPIVVGTAAHDAPPEPETDDVTGRPTGRTLDGTQAMGQALRRLEGGSWISIRVGSSIAIYEPTGNGEAFLSGIQIFKREILEGILTTARAILEAEHGSKVDTDAAHDNLLARLIGLGRGTLEQTWHRIMLHGTELNWGRDVAAAHTPVVTLGAVTARDVAKVVGAFGQAGWTPAPEHGPEIDALIGLTPRRSVMVINKPAPPPQGPAPQP